MNNDGQWNQDMQNTQGNMGGGMGNGYNPNPYGNVLGNMGNGGRQKKRFPLVLVIVLAIVVGLLCCCGSIFFGMYKLGVEITKDKEAVTYDDFCDQVEDLDIDTDDFRIKYSIGDSSHNVSYVIHDLNADDYQDNIGYVELHISSYDVEGAGRGIVEAELTVFDYEESSFKSHVTGPNYGTYKWICDDRYYCAQYVDNTTIHIECDDKEMFNYLCDELLQ